MLPFHRRRLRGRKPGRPGSPEPSPASPEPLGSSPRAADGPPPSAPSPAPQARRPQDSTVELKGVELEADPNAETSEALPAQPDPPRRLEFSCACGARLVATTETYDRRTRCEICGTIMLLNLVYDPERESHDIVPFRVNEDPLP